MTKRTYEQEYQDEMKTNRAKLTCSPCFISSCQGRMKLVDVGTFYGKKAFDLICLTRGSQALVEELSYDEWLKKGGKRGREGHAALERVGAHSR